MNDRTYNTHPGSYYVSVRESHSDFPLLHGFWVETGENEHFERLSRENLLLLRVILAFAEYLDATQPGWDDAELTDPAAEICEMLGDPPMDSVLRYALRCAFDMSPDTRYGLIQPIQEHLSQCSLHNRRKR